MNQKERETLMSLAATLRGIAMDVEDLLNGEKPPAKEPAKRDLGDPNTARDVLWKWAEARGVTKEAWRGTAMGLGLQGTNDLSAEDFLKFEKAIVALTEELQK